MIPLTAVEISRDALLHNYDALQSLAPAAEILAVVKANAYGHGLHEVVSILGKKPDAFQVDDLDELRALRRLTDRPAFVYGYVPRAGLARLFALGNVTLGLYDADALPEIARLGAKGLAPHIELKIDALLGRQGILPEETEAFLEKLAEYPNLRPDAVYAHYANIEDTTDLAHAQAQEGAFERAFRKVEKRYPGVRRHFAATSGLLARPDFHHDRVRLGIGLYGLYPSAPLARTHARLDLRPVLRWTTHLAQTKTLPAGHPVGYGLTYRTARPTRIGIVPQGYSDGYDRGLSNVGEVLVHGRRCPVVGRIAMNMFAVDLTNAPDAPRRRRGRPPGRAGRGAHQRRRDRRQTGHDQLRGRRPHLAPPAPRDRLAREDIPQ